MQDLMVIIGSMSWQVSIMLIVVLIVRKIFETLHICKKYMMFLWAIPFFCLICPWKVNLPNGFWHVAPTEMSAQKIAAEGAQVSFLHEPSTEEETLSMGAEAQNGAKAPSGKKRKISFYKDPYNLVKDSYSEWDYVRAADESSIKYMAVIGKEQSGDADAIMQRPDKSVKNSQEWSVNDSVSSQEWSVNDSVSSQEWSVNDSVSSQEWSVNDSISSQNRSENASISGQNPSANAKASNQDGGADTNTVSQDQPIDDTYNMLQALTVIWLIGILTLMFLNVISYIRLRGKLLCSIRIDEGIYMTDGIDTPMTVGMFKSRIYIPAGMSKEYERYALAHERTHIRRFDAFYKTAVYCIACIHWFNPIVWAAFYLFGKDMEMTCDEETVRRLGMEEQEAYAHALLAVADGMAMKNRITFISPMAFESGNVKDRIKNIMRYKRTVAYMGIAAVTLSLVIAAIFMTKDNSSQQAADETSAEEKMAAGDEARKCYREFIGKIETAIMDDFQSASTEDLDICDIFNDGIKTEEYSLGYYMIDLDRDGIDELVFGTNAKYDDVENIVYDIYTVKDGEVFRVTRGKRDNYFYLCGSGIIENESLSQSGYYHAYFNYNEAKMDLIETLICMTIHSKDAWYYNNKEISMESARAISTDEAYGILDEYGHSGISFHTFECPALESEPPTEHIPSPTPIPNYEDNDHLTFADLEGVEFWFGSGAGAWRTTVTIHADGTFEGEYRQGSTDHGGYMYPKGKFLGCKFSGQFTGLTKVAPYEYAMKCKSLKTDGAVGDEREVDGMRYVITEPYGFDDADAFALYLPGKSESELPQGYLDWSHGVAGSGVMTCYGLYNIGGEQGYMVWDFGDSDEYVSPEEPSPTPIPTLTPQQLTVRQMGYRDRDDLTFADLENQGFYSSRGGGRVDLQIHADGTFEAAFHEGYSYPYGDDFPNGVANECNYSGRFSDMTKTGPYEYRMKCEYVKVDGTVGEQRIVDGVRVTTTQPHGFDNADEFILYLPGKRESEMPETYREWLWLDGEETINSGYKLYNVGGEEFFWVPKG